jgi:SAM-dependent methyltransferase
LTQGRYRDAVELTRLVGLDHLVTLLHGDFLTLQLERESFDLVLGQGSFNHFRNRDRLLERSREVLRPGGHLAMEESILLRPPASAEESTRLGALADCWNGWWTTLDEWVNGMQRVGLNMISKKDLSRASHQDLLEALRLVEQGRLIAANPTEMKGWRLAVALTDAGLLGHIRLIARKL